MKKLIIVLIAMLFSSILSLAIASDIKPIKPSAPLWLGFGLNKAEEEQIKYFKNNDFAWDNFSVEQFVKGYRKLESSCTWINAKNSDRPLRKCNPEVEEELNALDAQVMAIYNSTLRVLHYKESLLDIVGLLNDSSRIVCSAQNYGMMPSYIINSLEDNFYDEKSWRLGIFKVAEDYNSCKSRNNRHEVIFHKPNLSKKSDKSDNGDKGLLIFRLEK